MVRLAFVSLGILSTALGIAGIFVPGLPTTVFLLIAAWLFARSSPRLYRKLLQHKYLGPFITDYRKHKSMPRKAKIIALTSMWSMVGISVVFAIQTLWIRVLLLLLAAIGSVVILHIPTRTVAVPTKDAESAC